MTASFPWLWTYNKQKLIKTYQTYALKSIYLFISYTQYIITNDVASLIWN